MKVLYTGKFVSDNATGATAAAFFSVVKNWGPSKKDQLDQAIPKLLEANPILTSHLESRKGESGVEVVAVFNTYGAKDLLRYIERPSSAVPSTPIEDMKPNELLAHVESHAIPHFPAHVSVSTRLGTEEIRERTPVFEVHVMDLSSNHACIAVVMSHVVGDGAVYFQVMEQLNAAMKGPIETKINWDGYDKLPEVLSHIIPHPVTLLGYMLGVRAFKQTHGKSAPDSEILLLSKDKVNKKKKELVDANTKFLSGNDVVVAALSEAMIDHATLQMQYANLRVRVDNLESNDAGNFIPTDIIDARLASGNPNVVRKVSSKGKSNISPWRTFMPLASGKFNRNTNLTKVSVGQFDDCVAYLPSAALATKKPFYFTAVFEYDSETLGVMTNCPMKQAPLLQSILLD
ncbi:expressed unknown protein [Seminavis robusta]|uniref:Uncharacterized protein n=1 Tax=Seminavis robusta TaxID=568900 RepID=A0A9N8HQ90_9STRA|nr:expressed unknown protein [Seminavis robusta]|eukprot:Sro963_g225340.1 n/a (402) ;mRNA; f:35833-37038